MKKYLHSFWKTDKADDMEKSWHSFWKTDKADDMKKSWRSFWATEKSNTWQEKEFFTIFSSTIDKLLRGDIEKIKVVSGLVDDFNSFIDKRSVIFLVVYDEVFPKILEWHFFVWEKSCQLKSEEDISFEWTTYTRLSLTFSDVLKKIEKRALKEGEAFSFFRTFIPHIEKHKKYFVEDKQGNKNYYVNVVMSDFFDTLVENIEYCRNIWGDIPREWKITMENIKKGESYVSNRLYVEFCNWARSRILSSTKYDKTLNDVAYNLFPHVCPIMWANILTFLMSGWEGGKRMKSLIERPLIFGGIGRSTAGWMGNDEDSERKVREDVEKQRQAEEEETISLALFLFGGDFTQDNLKNYIAELEALKSTHDNEGVMEYDKREYTYLFEKLLEARRKKDAEK